MAWPNQDPVGKHLTMGDTQRTVIGVVREPRLYEVHRNDRPQVFVPMAQNIATGVTLVVKAQNPTTVIAPNASGDLGTRRQSADCQRSIAD